MWQCTHNWVDHDVINMFKFVVSDLEDFTSNTSFLINDIVLSETEIMSRHKEREMRQIDMIMMISFEAKQRTKAEFETLLKKTNFRYEIRKMHDIETLSLLEINLKRWFS